MRLSAWRLISGPISVSAACRCRCAAAVRARPAAASALPRCRPPGPPPKCHAALARRAVRRTDQRIDRLPRSASGITTCDSWPRRAPARACRFGAAPVDVMRDRGGAHEAHRAHLRMSQQRIHGRLVALHHVEHAGRQAGLRQQACQNSDADGSRSLGLSTNCCRSDGERNIQHAPCTGS